MPEISKKAYLIQHSPIRKLKPLADRAKRTGKKVYHLNIGQPDIPTPREFLKGFQEAPEVLSYSPSQGLDEAVRALERYYKGHGIELERDEINVTVGGSEAVIFAMMTTLNPGDELIIPEPFYTNYNGYATMAGVEIVPLTTYAENGFRLPPKREIESKITRNTKAMLITNPGNPTGVVYTEGELETLKEIALKYDLFLISDEVYREFVYDGLKHRSVMNLKELEGHAILVDSISKRFSACGARIGALASRNKDVMEAVLKFAQARLSPPTAGQLGMIHFLNSPDYPGKVIEMIERFRERRDLLFEELQRVPGIFCTKPQGAFYIVAKLPVVDAEEFAKWLLSDFELDGETVMLAPASGFYKTEGLGKDEVRIAYVLGRESLKRAIEVLREGLNAYISAREAVGMLEH